MKICRITLDLAYQDDAQGAPKTENALRKLLDQSLDPLLGEYMTCTSGVLVKHVDYPDSTGHNKRNNLEAWFRKADEQLSLLDVERFAVTRVTAGPVPMLRMIKPTGKKR